MRLQHTGRAKYDTKESRPCLPRVPGYLPQFLNQEVHSAMTQGRFGTNFSVTRSAREFDHNQPDDGKPLIEAETRVGFRQWNLGSLKCTRACRDTSKWNSLAARETQF